MPNQKFQRCLLVFPLPLLSFCSPAFTGRKRPYYLLIVCQILHDKGHPPTPLNFILEFLSSDSVICLIFSSCFFLLENQDAEEGLRCSCERRNFFGPWLKVSMALNSVLKVEITVFYSIDVSLSFDFTTSQVKALRTWWTVKLLVS